MHRSWLLALLLTVVLPGPEVAAQANAALFDYQVNAKVQYRRALSGRGGRAPRAGLFQAGLRLFWRIWGE